jgi:uncharacterized coiled-coil protein SlyX
MLLATGGSLAQTANQDPTIADLQRQIQEMRSQMAKMQNRIAELETTNQTAEKNSSTDPILLQSQTPPAEALRSQLGEVKNSKETMSFRYKGITLTPGGFLESTILVRTRNENADMANSYTTIPLNGSSNAHLSEFRGTVRNSELSPFTEGYGVGFGALMPFVKKKVELSLEGLLGQGIGRYGSSGLPDVTLHPRTGATLPLRQGWIMGGVVYHRNSHLDLYAYGGDEYTGRYAFVSPTGTAAGYGSPLVDYSSCTNEVALNACNGANHNIYEATAGYWYRLYRG